MELTATQTPPALSVRERALAALQEKERRIREEQEEHLRLLEVRTGDALVRLLKEKLGLTVDPEAVGFRIERLIDIDGVSREAMLATVTVEDVEFAVASAMQDQLLSRHCPNCEWAGVDSWASLGAVLSPAPWEASETPASSPRV